MANRYHVYGYGAERGADPIIDTVVEDETGEGPEFYAFKVLHATGVVCALIYDAEGNDLPLVAQCDPGVNLHDVIVAVG